MVFVVTFVSAIIAFTIAYYMAMYTSKESKDFSILLLLLHFGHHNFSKSLFIEVHFC